MTGPGSDPASGEARAWGWVQHLRAGGTTPWSAWSAPAPAAGPTLPSAQQLELLRRINEAGRPADRLVQRVLTTSAPGRGRPDLALVGACPPADFGPPPVDPADLPAGELLRVATAVIAEDVVAAGLPAAPGRTRARPWRPRHRLVGHPELADPLRAQLAARGRPPGGSGDTVVVLAGPLDALVADLWTHCSFTLGPPRWGVWLRHVARNGLPPRTDPLLVARRWSERVGRDRVEVVLDPAALTDLLRLDTPLVVPTPTPAASADLARRVGPVLGTHVPADLRPRLMQRTLRPRLSGVEGPPAAVPERFVPWLAEHATRIADGLRRGGYRVHGDLDTLAPAGRPGVRSPDPAATLDVATRLMLEEGTG